MFDEHVWVQGLGLVRVRSTRVAQKGLIGLNEVCGFDVRWHRCLLEWHSGSTGTERETYTQTCSSNVTKTHTSLKCVIRSHRPPVEQAYKFKKQRCHRTWNPHTSLKCTNHSCSDPAERECRSEKQQCHRRSNSHTSSKPTNRYHSAPVE